MDIELATSDQLVAELMSRPTFQGLILRRHGEFKGAWGEGSNPFRLYYNNLELGEAQRLMMVVSNSMQSEATDDDTHD